MTCRLADNVQVRKENWGLLFYSPAHHKVCFVRSGEWLYPHYFDGTWSFESLVRDITGRLEAPAEMVERSLQNLTAHLINSGVVDELC